MDYHIVSQGKTVIPGVDDGEELTLTDVSPESDRWLISFSPYISLLFKFLILFANRLPLKSELRLSLRMYVRKFWCSQRRRCLAPARRTIPS